MASTFIFCFSLCSALQLCLQSLQGRCVSLAHGLLRHDQPVNASYKFRLSRFKQIARAATGMACIPRICIKTAYACVLSVLLTQTELADASVLVRP